MPGFLDRLKPQPKVTSIPTSEPVAPPIEAPKPVEITPPPEPDFTKKETNTPFETPMAFAQKYFEKIKEDGQLTPEIQAKMANFTEISHLLSEGWQAEQQATEAENNAKSPFNKLKDTLFTLVDRSNNKSIISQNMEDKLINNVKSMVNREKMISDKSDWEILNELITSGKVQTVLNIGSSNNDSRGAFDIPSVTLTKFMPMLRDLGAIPKETSLPVGGENGYLIKVLQKGGQTTSEETKLQKNMEESITVTKFTRPTSIDGVSVVVGFDNRFLENDPRINSHGLPSYETVDLKLAPEFYAKSLGIKSPEVASPESSSQ